MLYMKMLVNDEGTASCLVIVKDQTVEVLIEDDKDRTANIVLSKKQAKQLFKCLFVNEIKEGEK